MRAPESEDKVELEAGGRAFKSVRGKTVAWLVIDREAGLWNGIDNGWGTLWFAHTPYPTKFPELETESPSS